MAVTPTEQDKPVPVAVAEMRDDGRPEPEWVRGTCPQCGEVVVSDLWFIPGKGYQLLWVCWGRTADPPTCDWRRVVG